MSLVGSGPFEFTDDNGRQVSIPLAALKITNGTISVDESAWTLYGNYSADDKAKIAALLGEYSSQQQLTVAPAPTTHPALTLVAAFKGTSGNNITADIKVTPDPHAPRDPTMATMDFTIKAKEVYTGLTTDTLAQVFGDGTTPGSQPGLATVDAASVDKTKLPHEGFSASFHAPAAPIDHAKLDVVDDASATIFTLVARDPGNDGKFTKATVSAVDTTAKTFTLTLEWQNTVTGARLPTIAQDLAPLGYEVTVKPPPSGIFSLPAATGSKPLGLSGGTAGAPASATAYTGT